MSIAIAKTIQDLHKLGIQKVSEKAIFAASVGLVPSVEMAVSALRAEFGDDIYFELDTVEGCEPEQLVLYYSLHDDSLTSEKATAFREKHENNEALWTVWMWPTFAIMQRSATS